MISSYQSICVHLIIWNIKYMDINNLWWVRNCLMPFWPATHSLLFDSIKEPVKWICYYTSAVILTMSAHPMSEFLDFLGGMPSVCLHYVLGKQSKVIQVFKKIQEKYGAIPKDICPKIWVSMGTLAFMHMQSCR